MSDRLGDNTGDAGGVRMSSDRDPKDDCVDVRHADRVDMLDIDLWEDAYVTECPGRHERGLDVVRGCGRSSACVSK